MTDETIFAAALERSSPAERAAYLDSACAGDPEQRARIQRLLAAHVKASGFLEYPVGGTDAGVVTSVVGETALDRDDDEVKLAFLEPSTKPDSVGRLGHYEVLQVLGRGGFGIVLKAFDETLHRIVAVKVLSPEMAATSPARKRFLREARASAPIRHENVVQVYAIEETPLPYLVMEFVPGRTLQDYIDNTGPLETPDVVRIGVQIARGLAAAHELGLVHRDIKPANILLEGGIDLRVKLTDFGLARAVDDASMTASGTVAGTPMYMAPEQARGDKLDHRADLFSLGSVLYAMCTGHPPFRANSTLAVLRRVCDETPRPIPELIPETPRWLCDLITKLHAKNPAERYQTAKEVADCLVRGEIATPLPQSKAEPTRKTTPAEKLHPRAGRKLVIAVCVLLFAVVMGISLHLATKGDKPADPIANKEDQPPKKDTTPSSVVVETDALQVGSVWEGVATLKGIVAPNPGSLVITERSGTMFRGVSSWSFPVEKGKSELLVAEVEGQFNGKDLTFKDTKELKGPHFAEPTVFQATLKANRIQGTWSRTNDNAGTFDLVRRTANPDRMAAEYALSLGGSVQVNNQERRIKSIGDLPREAFELTHIDLSGAKLNDTGLVAFKDCKTLRQLWLSGTQVTDAGLVLFKDYTTLTSLSLFACKDVTDVGWACFKGCKNMTHLWLSGTQVSDAGLTLVKDCKNLTDLDIRNSKVTAEGLADLAKTLPQCKIEWDGGIIEPRKSPDRKVAEYVLSIGGIVRVNESNQEVQHASELPKEPFRLAVYLQGNKKISDVGLANFKDCKSLTRLELQSTVVSDAWLANFKGCTNLTHLHLHGTKVGDEGLAHFKDCKDLTVLWLGQTQVSDVGLNELLDKTKLTSLNLKNTKVTEAGVKKLAAALPVCKIEWDGGTFEPKASNEVDRKAAEYALSLRGTVQVRVGEQIRDIKTAADLPPEPFTLTRINIRYSKVKDAELAPFAECKNLAILDLGHSQVGDEGVAHFKGCKNLREIVLPDTKLGDDGLAHFKDCKELAFLQVPHTRVTDAGLATLKDCKKLQNVHLAGTKVTDTGIRSFITQSRLLRYVDLRETKVTEAGVQEFAAASPQCKIAWNGGTWNAPEDRKAAEYVLSIGGAIRINGEDRELKAAPDLPKQPFRLTALLLDGNPQVTDAGLASVKDCKNLMYLALANTKVSDAGLEHFKDSKNFTHIGLDNTRVSDEGLANFKDCDNLTRLWLEGTSVSDVGLKRIVDKTKLTSLKLRKSKVTEAGVKQLSTSLLGCMIEWDGSTIEPKK